MAQQEPLTQEREVYESHLEEWRQVRLGKFVLIKDGDVLGFYDSLEGAFNEGTERFQLEPFFVKQIMPEEVVNVSFFGKQLQST
jgi:hypothetical protein